MSALLPKADIDRRERHVRFVPIADIPDARKKRGTAAGCYLRTILKAESLSAAQHSEALLGAAGSHPGS